ncbi:MAG: helix-turn-helix domain-containing protein [Woeseiaceae bacterium]|nr:helix-turn-helix domain-containing protein [Woeseiaceae bacterium]
MKTHVVKRLDQAKLLTDPFKLKLLEQFGYRPVTTKQVADKMGEKAPRLYRHVDALFDAGLLELVEEKPKRGTVERYYRTIASRFEIDPELFAPSAERRNDAIDMMRTLLRDTESDLASIFSREQIDASDPARLPLLMRISVRGSDDEIRRLKQKLEEWLEECEELKDAEQPGDDASSYSGLLAFYRQPGDPDGTG